MTQIETSLANQIRITPSKRLRTALAVTWTALILLGCWLPRHHIPRLEGPSGILGVLHLDKLAHASMFLGFALLWRIAAPSRAWLRIVLAGILLIALTELGQSLPFVQRDADFGDSLADAIGLCLGLILMSGRAPRR